MTLTGSHHEHSLTTSLTRYFVGFATLLLLLTGCAGSGDPEAADTSSIPGTDTQDAPESPTEAEDSSSASDTLSTEESSEEPPEPTEPEIESLEDTDFSSISFQFVGYSDTDDSEEKTFIDGTVEAGDPQFPVTYELGEVIHQDLNGDGIVDAAVEIERYEGNSYDGRWYMWIATEDGPEQSPLPFARSGNCGDQVESVTATNEGLEVHERLRAKDDDVSCAEHGLHERTRTIAADYFDLAGAWWPVQVAPVIGYGGICSLTGDEGMTAPVDIAHVNPYKESASIAETNAERHPELTILFPFGEGDGSDRKIDGEWWAIGGIFDGSQVLGCGWVAYEDLPIGIQFG
ncbi:hypothetical protein [Auritidibacter ignavus]|uniref:hypothetical protein n=1 Tax=Auritidibacter ignavus TaxID=678932 RepID=UPI00109C3149|nr:hypothetical protein [Auritidibacter ignavus]